MKIGIFSAQYLPTMGGVERYTYEFARRARRAGHSVCVITSALPGFPQQEVSPEGIVIYRLPVWALMEQRFPIPKHNTGFRRMEKQIWAEGFDACVVQARFYVGSLYALQQTHRRGIPTILIDHSSGHLQPAGRLAAMIGHLYEHASALLVKRYCKEIYGVSNNVCRWLEHLGLQARGVFYNSVSMNEIDQIHSQVPDWNVRKILGLEGNTQLILFSSRLIPEKGIVPLIESIRLLSTRNVHLLVAGDGPLMPLIRDSAGNQIHVLGNVEHDKMIQLFSQATVYCLPTVYTEGFPTTLLEAASCGCPILVTNTSGVEELILTEDYGEILPNTKPETIATALDRVLSNDEWRIKSGLLLKRRVQEQFDWDVTARRILNKLEELTGEGAMQ